MTTHSSSGRETLADSAAGHRHPPPPRLPAAALSFLAQGFVLHLRDHQSPVGTVPWSFSVSRDLDSLKGYRPLLLKGDPSLGPPDVSSWPASGRAFLAGRPPKWCRALPGGSHPSTRDVDRDPVTVGLPGLSAQAVSPCA